MNQLLEKPILKTKFKNPSSAETAQLQEQYFADEEAIAIENFIDGEYLQSVLLPEMNAMRPLIHRASVPGYKSSGSVDYYTIQKEAPAIVELYKDEKFISFLSELSGHELKLCPEDDPHSVALYSYTQPGDRVGFHRDTSYYKGLRFTVLVSMIQNSDSCQLHGHFFKKNETKPTDERIINTEPGSVVFFNGNILWHGVTPLGDNPGEERFLYTLQYITDAKINRGMKFLSDLKDAMTYFGFKSIFRRKKKK